jgi:dipeptidyl aminopeptidase/acylaminoacyl peptidase
VFAPAAFSGLQQVPAAGGNAKGITLGAHFPANPSFLPDGRHFLFEDLRDSASDDGTLKVAALDGSGEKSIGPVNSYGVFADGRLLFLRGRALVSKPFDQTRLEAGQDTSPLAQNVLDFSASPDGTLIYRSGGPDVQQLTWFDRSGKALGTMGNPGNFYTIEFSPDRKKLALSVDDDVWIQDVERGVRSRFTFAPGIDTNPLWSPDGRHIAFCSNRSGRYGIYRKAADLSGSEESVYLDSIDTLPDGFSPDGRFLVVHRRDPARQEDLATVALSSDSNSAAGKLAPFVQTPFRELHARFSPDGRWIAYVSDESQHTEVYVTSFPSPRSKVQISTTGGGSPRWRDDGKELFFVSGNGTLMAAGVDTHGDAIKVGAIQPLGIMVTMRTRGWMYDVSADSQKFLVAMPPKEKPEPLTIVSNWQRLLKK